MQSDWPERSKGVAAGSAALTKHSFNFPLVFFAIKNRETDFLLCHKLFRHND